MDENIRLAVLKRIEGIELQAEYDLALNTYQTSNSPFKSEAIQMLQKAFPLFNKGASAIYATASKQIEESQADISDMRGN